MLLSSVFVSFDLRYHGGADRFFVCCLIRPPAVTRHRSPQARSCSTGPLNPFLFNHGNNRDLPGSWGASISGLPRSSTPEGRSCLAYSGSSVQPPIRRRRPLQLTRFRGCLTRLPGSLSTLPRLRYLRRARLASGWWPAFTGWAFFTHKAPLVSFRFNLSTHVIPSSFSRLILARRSSCLCVNKRDGKPGVRMWPGILGAS